MMIRSVLSNYVGMAVSTVVAFLLTPILIHRLGDFHYGMWVLVASVLDYYGLADVGIRFTLQRYVARFKGSNQREALDRTFASALSMTAGISALILVLTGFLAHILPAVFWISGSEQTLFSRVLILLGASFAVSLPAKVLAAYLCGLQRFDLYNLAGTSNSIVQAGLIIAVLHWGYGIQGCAAVSLGMAVVSLFLHRRLLRWADPQISFDWRKGSWSELRELFNFGVYVFVNQIGDLLRFRLDSLVIARWLNISLVTRFNVAARLIEFFRFITAGIIGPLITEMSELEGQSKERNLQELFLSATKWTALISLLICAFLCLNGRTLLALWVGKGFVSSYAVLVVLALSRTAATLQSPSMVILLARGRHRALGWWTLCEGLANLALSIHWAGKYGIVGVAMGTAVPMLLSRILLQPWYTLRVVELSAWDYLLRSLARPLMVLGAFLAFARMIVLVSHPAGLLSFFLTVVWQLSIYGLLAYALGLTASERELIREQAKKLVFSQRMVHDRLEQSTRLVERR